MTATLQERAAVIAANRETEDAEKAKIRAENDRERAIGDLVYRVDRWLGVKIVQDDTDYDADRDEPKATTVIDGLTFGIVRHWPDEAPDLSVAVNCRRGCGSPVWVNVQVDYQLSALHAAITQPQTHRRDCLVKYDDEGEPVTDREGKPLGPVPPTPLQRARASIEHARQVTATAERSDVDGEYIASILTALLDISLAHAAAIPSAPADYEIVG